MVEPIGESHQEEASRSDSFRLGAVITVGVVALLVGWVFGSSSGVPTSTDTANGEETATESTTSPSLTLATTTTTLRVAETTEPRNGGPSPLRGLVEAFPGATELAGSVALA